MMAATLTVLGNLFADLALTVVDPRVSLEGKRHAQ